MRCRGQPEAEHVVVAGQVKESLTRIKEALTQTHRHRHRHTNAGMQGCKVKESLTRIAYPCQ